MASGKANIVHVERGGSGLAHEESPLRGDAVFTAELFYLEEAAFRTLEPGCPIIPREELLKVIGYKAARKLGTAYNLGSGDNWPVLKQKLDGKRKEVLVAYRKELIARADKKALEGSLLKRKPDQTKHRWTSHESVDSQNSAVSDAARHKEKGLPPIILAAPRPRSPVFKRRSPCHAATLQVKEENPSNGDQLISREIGETLVQLHRLVLRGGQHAPTDTCADSSGFPVNMPFVNVRRKRGRRDPIRTQERFTVRLREALHDDDNSLGLLPRHSRNNVAAAQYRESNPMGPIRPPSTPARNSRRQSRNAVVYPMWDPENERCAPIYTPLQSTDVSPLLESENESEAMYSHSKSGGSSGGFASSAASKRDVEEAVSASLYRRAQRSGCMLEGYPTMQGQSSRSDVSTEMYDSDTSVDDDADDADSTWSSTIGESPTAVTLRRLARLRDEMLRAKQARANESQNSGDYMTAPVPVSSIDETCRSTPTVQYCSFEFRGLYAEIPQTDERVGRTPGSLRRRPEWYVRRDAESPTPVRRSRTKAKNSAQEEHMCPLPSASGHESDEDSVDMDITPISLVPRIKFTMPVSSRQGETPGPFVV